MKTPHENPSAFPVSERDSLVSTGMSLRDYFAAQAIVGWAVSDLINPDNFAERAYCIADAMLKKREEI